MSSDRLMLAAVLAFVHAVLTRFMVSFTAEITRPSPGPLLLTTLLALVGFGLFVFLFATFKRLLNEQHNFHEADLPIMALIGLNAVGVALILLPVFGLSAGLFSLLSKGTAVVIGLAWLALGVQLLKLPAGSIRLLRPYAFVVAAAGVSLITVILATLGVLLNLAADILLGVIFIQQSGKPEGGRIEA